MSVGQSCPKACQSFHSRRWTQSVPESVEYLDFVACRAKDVAAEKDRRATAAAKAATALDRATRRRTNFEFDLWDAKGKVTDTARTKIGSAIESDDWIDGNMRLHNLKSTRSLVRKLPDDYGRELSRLNKVEVPHPGASYNPSYSDHQVKNEVLLSPSSILISRHSRICCGSLRSPK